jgi:carbon storage regulator CsrA
MLDSGTYAPNAIEGQGLLGPRRKPLLVLTRKPDQTIVVSWSEVEVRFKIIRCGRDKVAVGVEAPPNVKILRGELEGERPAA